jgi:hypothetical protein
MKKLPVAAKKDFIKSISSSKPIDALAELIWNGFDAGSNRVQVFLDMNNLNAIENIRIRDFGYGIDSASVADFFGNLGESWKKHKARDNGRALHGKNGKGRFKAFALGERVDWKTIYKNSDGQTASYTISGSANTIDSFEASDPILTPNATLGTEVFISNIETDYRSLKDESPATSLAKIFAPYLTEYPDISLEYNGQQIDPRTAQLHRADYHLGDVELAPNLRVPVSVTIIEWSIKTEREFHLCDADGVSLHALSAGNIRAPGFNFTAYVKADHFRELDKNNNLALEELDEDIKKILTVAKSKIQKHFRQRILENDGQVIERWKKENIYPYEDKVTLNPIERAERQVFDILAINVQSYLPSFEHADQKSKKFTFRLLAQAVKDNPESVQIILSEVLGLKKKEQDELAKLLTRTSLSSIISSASVVADRLNFLIGLENLLFDKETKKKLLERDQLHKILDQEAWLFNEEFTLAGSELSLEEVLKKHIAKLGNRADDADNFEKADTDSLRIDLMLHKAIQPRPGEFDYLVIELKRPSKKIDSEVLTQIKKYAMVVSADERFRGVKIRWTFLAISNDLDEYAQQETRQKNRPNGLAWEQENITVWAKSWAEVINDARTKLSFFNQQLAYAADRDSAKEYLQKTHSHFIPERYQSSDIEEITEETDA